jgi:hypothetical protein
MASCRNSTQMSRILRVSIRVRHGSVLGYWWGPYTLLPDERSTCQFIASDTSTRPRLQVIRSYGATNRSPPKPRGRSRAGLALRREPPAPDRPPASAHASAVRSALESWRERVIENATARLTETQTWTESCQVKNQFKVVKDLRDTRTDASAQCTTRGPFGARVLFTEVSRCLAS